MSTRKALASFEAMNRRVCRSAEELTRTMRDMAALLPDMVDGILREVVETLYLDLAGQGTPPTPIRSGRARSGWVLDTKESDWAPPNMDANPQSPEEILTAVKAAIDRLPPSAIYYLYNNVPYILRLERGHSHQAPSGFIALALAAMRMDLQRKIEELNRGRA